MYSLEERLLAVKTYYEIGKNAKATVRRLGYPDETQIARWVREYEQDHCLHEQRVHYSKYTESEKQAAVDYYYTHGRNGLQTVKALGYCKVCGMAHAWTCDCYKNCSSSGTINKET